jgi:hypothetical protein
MVRDIGQDEKVMNKVITLTNSILIQSVDQVTIIIQGHFIRTVKIRIIAIK